MLICLISLTGQLPLPENYFSDWGCELKRWMEHHLAG